MNLQFLLPKTQFVPKPDLVLINLEPVPHQLSKEEQIFFRNVTEAIFGYSEQIRNEMLKQISIDYNVTLILPYLCRFIKDSIHFNIVFCDLTLLIYAVRMTKSLMVNEHLNLKPYLHELLPAILSCCLAKKISKYYLDNHWTLRDFSAFVVAAICQAYSDELNDMKNRVIAVYLKGLKDPKKCLATMYGAIKGISCFGENEIKQYILPNLMVVSNKIQYVVDMINYNYFQKQLLHEANHVRNMMVTICAPILYKTRPMNDGGLSYVKDYGYFGKSLYIHVKNLENMDNAKLQQQY